MKKVLRTVTIKGGSVMKRVIVVGLLMIFAVSTIALAAPTKEQQIARLNYTLANQEARMAVMVADKEAVADGVIAGLNKRIERLQANIATITADKVAYADKRIAALQKVITATEAKIAALESE